jgi:hypothetical protein
VFESLVLRGASGSILWGYRTAAELRSWTIRHHRPDVKHDARWTLHATFARANRFELRQRPLLFTAPRPGLPQACWPLHTASIQIGETQLSATLGPPEQ